jgi:hypothetical protein
MTFVAKEIDVFAIQRSRDDTFGTVSSSLRGHCVFDSQLARYWNGPFLQLATYSLKAKNVCDFQ